MKVLNMITIGVKAAFILAALAPATASAQSVPAKKPSTHPGEVHLEGSLSLANSKAFAGGRGYIYGPGLSNSQYSGLNLGLTAQVERTSQRTTYNPVALNAENYLLLCKTMAAYHIMPTQLSSTRFQGVKGAPTDAKDLVWAPAVDFEWKSTHRSRKGLSFFANAEGGIYPGLTLSMSESLKHLNDLNRIVTSDPPMSSKTKIRGGYVRAELSLMKSIGERNLIRISAVFDASNTKVITTDDMSNGTSVTYKTNLKNTSVYPSVSVGHVF
ncbi:MAG: hypothetical protein H7222_16395 [Methylotenera sp.]|nr:hypothetical protein [Oligoflexia bacterium]